MSKYFKYYKMLLMWKDIRKVYAEENNGQENPAYLTRRFLGVFFLAVAYAVSVLFNIVIPPEMLSALTDNIVSLQEMVKVGLPVIAGLYGSLTAIVGIAKRSK